MKTIRFIISSIILLGLSIIGILFFSSQPFILWETIYLPKWELGNEIIFKHELAHLQYSKLSPQGKSLVDNFIENYDWNSAFNYPLSIKRTLTFEKTLENKSNAVCKSSSGCVKGEYKQYIIDTYMNDAKYSICKLSESCVKNEVQAFFFQENSIIQDNIYMFVLKEEIR